VKVCYISMTFPAPYETFACSDIRALKRAGIDVSVRTLRSARPDSTQLLAEQQLQQLRVDHNGARAMLRGLCYALFHPAVTLDLVWWLCRFSWRRPGQFMRSLLISPRAFDILGALRSDVPHVVHLFWGHYPSIVGYLVRRHLPDTIVSMFIGAYDLEARYGPSAPLARSADVVWTHAEANVQTLEQLGARRERICVCHRGLEVDRFAVTVPKIAGRVVAIGRLAAEKTMADVLEVFAAVLSRHPTATLAVIGDGPERSQLEALASAREIRHAVTFMGRVPQDVVRDELARASVLLYMARSDTDRLPNVIKEAMAAECLCVVTRTRAIDELLQDGVHGFVVERADIEGGTAKVDWALANPDQARAIGRAALAHVRAHFDVARAMAAYAERWEQLVRLGRRSNVAAGGAAHTGASGDDARPVASLTGTVSSYPES